MCTSAKSKSSCRVEHIVDGAAGRDGFAFWECETVELILARDRAVTDARSFERCARHRRKAARMLKLLIQGRETMAARYAEARAEAIARRQQPATQIMAAE